MILGFEKMNMQLIILNTDSFSVQEEVEKYSSLLQYGKILTRLWLKFATNIISS